MDFECTTGPVTNGTGDPAAGFPSDTRPALSIVIPVFNEEESLSPLHAEVREATAGIDGDTEIIFVDDGSTDDSRRHLEALASQDASVRYILFRRNFGKAAALDAGFSAARGRVVFTMDADLQDDPSEIPRFLAALDNGYDVVSGWKAVRNDPLHKTLPSRLFNTVVGRMSGVRLNDFNCGFKAYRAEALDGLSLYGELHRFIPVLLHWRGFRIGEIPVNHRARPFGRSKYGVGRLLKGAFDFLSVMLNTRFATRPLHVFGGAGLVFGILGTGILAYLTALWFSGLGPIGDRPLLIFGLLLVMPSFQFVTIGLLAEFIQHQGAGRDRPYAIAATRNLNQVSHDRPDVTDSAIRELTEIGRQMREIESDARDDHSLRHQRSASGQV
ncbi:MAG: glycosyltransferase family 2 protein [Pseudomonadota bacterium]